MQLLSTSVNCCTSPAVCLKKTPARHSLQSMAGSGGTTYLSSAMRATNNCSTVQTRTEHHNSYENIYMMSLRLSLSIYIYIWRCPIKVKSGRKSEGKMDMGGSGDPAQTNIIEAHGAHGPNGGRADGTSMGGQETRIAVPVLFLFSFFSLNTHIHVVIS